MIRVVGTALCIVMATLSFCIAAHAGDAQYVGAGKCKMCHNKKSEVQQYQIWADSKHAHAYETLATPKAKEYATKAGIEGDPQKAKDCLECHVTGYGLDSALFAESFVPEDGVQCESCHGPGSEYKKISIMSASKYTEDREGQHKLALKAGLIIPDEESCKTCHNDRSPAFKGFDFAKYYEKIKHEYAAE